MSKPITITLQKIRAATPCACGWETLLKSKGGVKADYSAEFPLADVIKSNGFDDAIWCMRCLPEHDRIWRKYAVWCARQTQHLMTDQRSLDALDVADRHADGMATDAELDAARDAAWAAWDAARGTAGAEARAARAAAGAAGAVAGAAAWDSAWDAAWAARAAAGDSAWGAARDAQKQKLSDVLTAGAWV